MKNFEAALQKFKASINKQKKEVIGVAFGSGAARGWSHIGVIKALNELGIKPQVVTGTSIGSVAAAIYAAGTVDQAEEYARKLTPVEAASLLMEVRVPSIRKPLEWKDVFDFSGLLKGKRAMEVVSKFVPAINIEKLGVKYGAVATDLYSEQAVEFTSGPIRDAIRASISIPGIFTPVERGNQLLVDGMLADPVPVTLAHKLGATKVIAINITPKTVETCHNNSKRTPNIFGVIDRTWRIVEKMAVVASTEMQQQDILIEPLSKNFSPLNFSKANELIDCGYNATKAALADKLDNLRG